MRRLLTISLAVLLLAGLAGAGYALEATTDDGRKVILQPDGTWTFKQAAESRGSSLTKPATSTKVLKSKKGFYELWYDPNKWSTQGGPENKDAEFTFKHSSGDAFAMIIAERMSMPLDSLKKVALENARKVASEARIVAEETREVNGVKILHMRIDGTINGIPFTYFSYYWTGQAGVIQAVTFTGQNLLEELKPDLTDFLNGLVITRP